MHFIFNFYPLQGIWTCHFLHGNTTGDQILFPFSGMIKGVFQVNNNKYLFATLPFPDISLFSFPIPTPYLRDPIIKNDLGCIREGNSLLQKENDNISEVPPNSRNSVCSAGVLDGNSWPRSEAIPGTGSWAWLSFAELTSSPLTGKRGEKRN